VHGATSANYFEVWILQAAVQVARCFEIKESCMCPSGQSPTAIWYRIVEQPDAVSHPILTSTLTPLICASHPPITNNFFSIMTMQHLGRIHISQCGLEWSTHAHYEFSCNKFWKSTENFISLLQDVFILLAYGFSQTPQWLNWSLENVTWQIASLKYLDYSKSAWYS